MGIKRGAGLATIDTSTKRRDTFSRTEIGNKGYIFRGYLGDSTDVNPSDVRFSMEHSESVLVVPDNLPPGTTLVACAFDATADYDRDTFQEGSCTGLGAFRLVGENTQWTPIDLGGAWEISRAADGDLAYSRNMMLVPIIGDIGFAVYHTKTKELLTAGELREVVVRFLQTKTKIIVPQSVWPGVQ